jgi:DNA polymerase epsilon subunit 1
MAVLCFFQSEDGELIKCMIPYKPYFYISFEAGCDKEVHAYLESKVERIESIELISKVDLEEINHLSGRKKEYLKVNFRTVKDLTNAKAPLKSLIDKRKKRQN